MEKRTKLILIYIVAAIVIYGIIYWLYNKYKKPAAVSNNGSFSDSDFINVAMDKYGLTKDEATIFLKITRCLETNNSLIKAALLQDMIKSNFSDEQAFSGLIPLCGLTANEISLAISSSSKIKNK